MVYTNDVQNSGAASASGDSLPEATDNGFDLDHWVALQQAYLSGAKPPSPDLGTDSVVSAAEQGMSHINSVAAAAVRLSTAQSVANVHILNDNFVRDSITGK